MIRDYTRCHPAFGPDFQALGRTALEDRRVVAAVGDREAGVRLRALIEQLGEPG